MGLRPFGLLRDGQAFPGVPGRKCSIQGDAANRSTSLRWMLVSGAFGKGGRRGEVTCSPAKGIHHVGRQSENARRSCVIDWFLAGDPVLALATALAWMQSDPDQSTSTRGSARGHRTGDRKRSCMEAGFGVLFCECRKRSRPQGQGARSSGWQPWRGWKREKREVCRETEVVGDEDPRVRPRCLYPSNAHPLPGPRQADSYPS